MIATAPSFDLRDYQRRAVDDVKRKIASRPILVAPTGSGKTVMATSVVQELGLPTLWLAHRKELIDQADRRLRAHGLETGIVMAGYQLDLHASVQVASVQTLVRREKPSAQLIVVDECHHAAAKTYQQILGNYPDAFVVGLTATPFRLDGCGLGELFGDLVVAAHADELCRAGHLHRPKVWASKAPDLRGVAVVAGDYSLSALARRSNTAELNADIVETWMRRAAGKRTVAFAVDIKHSQAIAQAFLDAGVPAEHLDGATARTERDAILGRLAAGETQVVCNCMVLTEGWDLPALECAIIARPTASLNLHLQMIGRVMRACDGKDGAIVLDHAGNHHVHGLVTRRLNYTLTEEKIGSDEPLGLRRCGNCGVLFEETAPRCPECGWVPTGGAERHRPPVHGEGELVEFNDADFEYRRDFWRQLEAQRQAAGHKPGWSYYQFRDRFGEAPVVTFGELVDPPNATLQEKRGVFRHLTEVAARKGYKPGWASYRFREIFGHWPKGFVQQVREEVGV